MILARPYISRRRLITGAAALAAFGALPRQARAAATTWNIADGNAAFLMSNGNLTLETMWKIVGVAYDIDNNKAWTYDPHSNLWNNDVLANQNPATGAGGYTPSGIGAGGYFPMWTGYKTSAPPDVAIANFGASAFWNMPSGFSSVNTLAGASVTWDSSNKSADITLSNGNLTASKTGGSGTFNSVKATHSISSGKAYYELAIPSVEWQMHGWGNSSASVSTYAGDNANSFGAYTRSGVLFYLFNSAASSQRAFASEAWYAKSIRATNASAAGQKLMFEARITWTGLGNFPTGIGIGNASALLDDFVGENVNSYGMFGGNANNYWTNNSNTTADALTSGDWFGVYVDTSNDRLWFYNPTSGDYNSSPTADPATNTGGFDISGLGKVLFPMAGTSNTPGENQPSTIEANFAGSFSSPVPAGFCAWDAAGTCGGGARSRGLIIQ